jgi:hypothetical protein
VNEVLAWLLGLERLRFGQPNVEFGFARPLPEWGWALVILGAAGAAWWSYRRLLGPTWWRAVLGVARALVLVVLAVLVAGPRLIKPNETRERDWVIVLVDRSASMTVRDVGAAGGDGLITREEQLRRALEESSPLWRELAKERVVLWMGFDAQAFELEGEGGPTGGADPRGMDAGNLPVALDAPVGRRTAIGRALDQALKRAAARPLAGVVVLSDGRSADEVSRTVVRRLESEKIPVFVVPIGSDRALQDVAVRAAEAPASAFVNDIVPVQVELERVGPAQGRRAVNVELVDTTSGEVLDQRRVEPPTDEAAGAEGADAVTQAVTLTAKPVRAGPAAWTVRVTPEGDDLTGENNRAQLELTLEDRPLRAVYFDGSPRWEFRYLKNLLIREKSIVSSNLVLSPGRSYVQEGDEALSAMPTTPAQWREFDVVILGDVSPEVFTPEQLLQLRDLVATRGAGLIWIGGEGATPSAWAGTPMADLIPFGPTGGDASAGESLARAWDGEVVVRPTETAARYGVLRLRSTPDEAVPAGSALSWWPAALSDAGANWSRLRWAQRIDRASLKPSAEVLAEAQVVSGADVQRGGPVVLTMRYGAGRVLYVATDEIWRWRYGRGEDLPEKFWLPLVRLLGRDSLARSGAAARLTASPARTPVDAPVRVMVELLDQRLIDEAPPTVTVRVSPIDAETDAARSGAAQADVVLTPEDGGGGGIGAGSRRYVGLWPPPRAGRFRAAVADALLSDQRLTADIDVWLPDDEMRRPQADHPRLAELAAATEGRVIEPAKLGTLGPLLPNRRVVLVGAPEEETLWDSPLALMLMLGLLTAEWVGRRLIRFV